MQENNKRENKRNTADYAAVKRRRKPDPARRRRKKQKVRRELRIIAAIAFALVLLALLLALLWRQLPHKDLRRYPMEYTELIRSNAAQQGLDPAQVAAVILAESGYDPEAVSSVNAQGLMQIMPDTGKWLAGKFDEEYVEGCLFDPETNIRYGCWYLGYLMRRYDGDITCATAAYHSGQGTVDGWLADPAFSSDGRHLIDIKGKNAKTYVSRVLEYYEEYQYLYGPA